jgi:cell division septation protein DedD
MVEFYSGADGTFPFKALPFQIQQSGDDEKYYLLYKNTEKAILGGKEYEVSFEGAESPYLMILGAAEYTARSTPSAAPPLSAAPSSAAPLTSPTSARTPPAEIAALPANIAYCVQAGAFKDIRNAEILQKSLRKYGFSAVLEKAGDYSRVVITDLEKSEAQDLAGRLHSLGYKNLWVREAQSHSEQQYE